RLLYILFGSLVPVIPALQIRFVGLGIDWSGTDYRLFGHPALDLGSNVARYVVLQIQHVFEVALVAFGPKMAVGAAIDQLCCDANALACASHSPLDDSIGAEFPRDLGQREFCIFVSFDRGVRNDAQ